MWNISSVSLCKEHILQHICMWFVLATQVWEEKQNLLEISV